MLSDTPQELTLTATTPLMSVATSESVGVMNEHMSRFEVIGQQSKTEFHMEYTRPFKRPRTSEIVPKVGMPGVPNRAITCNIFKTKMCQQFRLGCCIYGDKCSFAHGIGDIRKPVSPCQGLVQEDHSVKVWDEEPRMINRMKLCRIFFRGEICPYGDRCLFLHGGPEKLKENSGRFRQSFTRSMAATGSSRGNRTGSDSTFKQRSVSDHVVECKGSVNLSLDADRLHSKPISWKTKLCNKWVTTGDCSYGEKCIFAHGKAELKNLGRNFGSDSGKAHITATQMTLANEASPGETTTSSSYKWQVQSKKCLLKLKELEKISGIYADWIDDIPLVHSLPNKIQT